MPIGYKTDVLGKLKAAGYSTYKLRKEKILAESVIQRIRSNEPITWDKMAIVCELLDCQPGDILEYRK